MKMTAGLSIVPMFEFSGFGQPFCGTWAVLKVIDVLMDLKCTVSYWLIILGESINAVGPC